MTQPLEPPITMTMSDFVPEATSADDLPHRDIWQSLKRGWRQKCPSCGDGRIYGKFLKVNGVCSSCGTELFHHRADDAPPYFVMTISGHVIVSGILITERMFSPPTWVELAVWLPVTVLLSLWLLPRVKGALIGYQWALRMHGFGNPAFDSDNLAQLPPSSSETVS